MKAKTLVYVSVFLAIVVIGLYTTGQLLNVIPQPVLDLVAWADKNTVILLVTLCFIVACVTIIKVVGGKRIIKALKEAEYA